MARPYEVARLVRCQRISNARPNYLDVLATENKLEVIQNPI
jgi:hypothetical protein